ncbi:MAG: hypothetical protein IIY16_03340 [Oscillospiraceae bacterium]|nr:hypothetical protein [Oscillospiraceae bacterium]
MAVTPERMAEGRMVFEQLIEHLHKIKLNFAHETLEDRYLIKFNMSGDDLPMRFFLYVNPEHQLLTLHSPLPVTFAKDKIATACVALCAINYRLTDGDFQIDIRDGEVIYNMSNCYAGSRISSQVFDYMLGMSINIVDEFNDQLLMLSKDLIKLNDIVGKLNYNKK